ncbi:MAG: nicotinate-nucleotide--dimethylbenzimidazole phosphoribosyltransferase, partial [Lachnospiraceae bacterium]|nr:nicotinate-nucleotide--dimethylbenzimidazole phosphoribosyltransferase [Lachnospiraceae bacterium]
MNVKELLKKEGIEGYDRSLYQVIRRNWDKVAKPLDSMGIFEPVIAQIGAIQHTEHPEFEKLAVIVFAADNGVVEEGVSQAGQEVTAICAENMCKGLTSVCVMAKASSIETKIVDIGLAGPVVHPNLIEKNVRRGTRNFRKEPAMTKEEVYQAMEVGFQLAVAQKRAGYDAIGVGEIGIGNTTTSSAAAAALLHKEVRLVTGYGAGLSDEGLKRKVGVISESLAKHRLYDADPLTVLQT